MKDHVGWWKCLTSGYGDGHITVNICQNSFNYTLEIGEFYCKLYFTIADTKKRKIKPKS